MAEFDVTSPDGTKFRVSAPEGATQEQVLSYAQDQFAKMPKASKPMAANAGLSNFIASAAGLPVDTMENAVNLGIAGVGALGTATGLMKEPPNLLHGSVGTSEHLKSLLRKTGEPGLSPDNPNPKDPMGTLQYDLTSRGAFLPGSALPALGSVVAERTLGPEWAGVGSLTPSAAVQLHNEMRAASLKKAQAQNVVRDETLKNAQDAGYKVPPSAANPTFVGNRLESVAGKAAVGQEATLHNQTVTDQLARKAASLPEGAPITEGALAKVRSELAQPYREIANISGRAQYALEALKDARYQSNVHWKHYDRSADPKSLATAKNYDAKIDMLENLVEKEATRAGKPELVQQLRDARTAIAKNYQVERALNIGDGTVDARIIGRALDSGARLTGELETIAKFAQGPGAKFTRPSSVVPTPGVSAAEPFASAMLGSQGSWWEAGLPLIRGPVRAGLLSDVYQRNFARPSYTPSMQPEPSFQALGRLEMMQQEEQRRRSTK